MGRLIDADILIEKLKRTSAFEGIRNAADKNVFEIINEQPTAFDVKNVVEQMKEEKEVAYADFNKYARDYELDLEDLYDDFYHKGLNRAIEIIIKEVQK